MSNQDGGVNVSAVSNAVGCLALEVFSGHGVDTVQDFSAASGQDTAMENSQPTHNGTCHHSITRGLWLVPVASLGQQIILYCMLYLLHVLQRILTDWILTNPNKVPLNVL
ncbi:hypothetical protein XENTR_v10015776 [Xenopus tropicalis]|nr:hypothetical protein XENTR_v10015776 [Xenopus tropicalis]